MYDKASGRLKRIEVNAGDSVRKGDLLAEMDSPRRYPQVRFDLALSKGNPNQGLVDHVPRSSASGCGSRETA